MVTLAMFHIANRCIDHHTPHPRWLLVGVRSLMIIMQRLMLLHIGLCNLLMMAPLGSREPQHVLLHHLDCLVPLARWSAENDM